MYGQAGGDLGPQLRRPGLVAVRAGVLRLPRAPGPDALQAAVLLALAVVRTGYHRAFDRLVRRARATAVHTFTHVWVPPRFLSFGFVPSVVCTGPTPFMQVIFLPPAQKTGPAVRQVQIKHLLCPPHQA